VIIDASTISPGEAEQDALLHPGVDAPAQRARRVGLGARTWRTTAPRAAAFTMRAASR
jgi:hypothetical protein